MGVVICSIGISRTPNAAVRSPPNASRAANVVNYSIGNLSRALNAAICSIRSFQEPHML